MKFKLIVASMLFAASAPASAAIALGSTGNSSVILSLIDRTAGVSAVFDLGVSKNDFISSNVVQAYANSDKQFNLSTGDYSAAWTSFWTSATQANTEWAVIATDGSGAATGNKSIFTTAASTTNWGSTQNQHVGSIISTLDIAIGNYNGLSTHSSATNGGSFSNSGATLGSNLYNGSGLINGVGADMTNSFGSSLSLVNLTTSSTTGSAISSFTNLGSSLSLASDGTLSYVAAVPEAETSAMMLAGICLMGFIARRRKTI